MRGPATDRIRPTSDRLRESLFNILEHGHGGVDGLRVIDLFAGTGALGLEAISRGARFALFVDDGVEARALLRANVETLGVGGSTRVFRRDARKLGAAPAGETFDLAFLDPPYRRELAPPALISLRDGGWLTPGGLVVIEESAEAEIPTLDGFEDLDLRTFGDTRVVLRRYRPEPA